MYFAGIPWWLLGHDFKGFALEQSSFKNPLPGNVVKCDSGFKAHENTSGRHFPFRWLLCCTRCRVEISLSWIRRVSSSITPAVPCWDIISNFGVFYKRTWPQKIYSRLKSLAIHLAENFVFVFFFSRKNHKFFEAAYLALPIACSSIVTSRVRVAQISGNFLGTLCQSILSPRLLMRSRSTDPLWSPSRP